LDGSNPIGFFEVNAGDLEAVGNVGKKTTWAILFKMKLGRKMDHVDR
jgi:hypothetical protein